MEFAIPVLLLIKKIGNIIMILMDNLTKQMLKNIYDHTVPGGFY